MSYFSDNYKSLSYPTDPPGPGLYNAQIGAIHALGSHFTVNERPAIITMPTGSGKTAVLMMTPFLLQSTRVLVITPSQFVRWQIAEDFAALATLKAAGVFPADIALPRLLELKKQMTSDEAWEGLRPYDIVVSTPNCTSPSYEKIPAPPADLFDLVLIDEAHHSASNTWAGLIDAFPNTRRALFTATPFRRDRGEIPGRFVYTYPVARAYEDRIFGKIEYVPVEPTGNAANDDIAIARKTEEIFQADRAANLEHYVMVRTDRRTRAESLAEIYSQNTGLRLAVVHSGVSNTQVKNVLEALNRGELDGLICVSMLGEGFNFPKLKIAAIHSPHRSLEVTLQFIGRFARTNAVNIGQAKFIGLTNEMEIEGERLFETGAVWQDLVTNLSHGRVENERDVRERLEEFDHAEEKDPDLEDLSTYSLYPRSHVKVYDIPGPVDLRQDFDFSSELKVQYRSPHQSGDILILISRERSRPKWSSSDKIINSQYDLVVLYIDRAHNLLFINASKSLDGSYDKIARLVSPQAKLLPTALIRRVVRGINNQQIFSIGMRSIQATSTTESYRIIAGRNTPASIRPADSRLFRQGHAFMSGDTPEGRVTIGYSSGSKVWAAASAQVPGLVDWCTLLGEKIRTTGEIVTHSGLDYLSAGEVVTEIPEHIVHVEWPKEAFELDPPFQVEYRLDDGTIASGHILDLELSIEAERPNRDQLTVNVTAEGLTYPVILSLADDEAAGGFYTSAAGDDGRIRVIKGQQSTTFIQFLNAFYLDFFTADGALFSGNELYAPSEAVEPIDPVQIEEVDWAGTNIRAEVTGGRAGRSVHEHIRAQLEQTDAELILYDHGSGEVGDFVTLHRHDGVCQFAFYHCKGSATATPGARVKDVYEVCSQAQKSVGLASLARLQARLHVRRNLTQFVRGDRALLNTVLEEARNMRHRFEVVVVQPGISKARLSEGQKQPMGATDLYLRSAGCAPLRILASA